MVFESLVADLVNRFLGDFIENLDKSQLSIGIWGGDVVLNNLFVKESALDELDLPVRVQHGNIGKLVLKIPWKNLYTAPVVANLDGLYIIAAPNASIKYNDEKEKKAAWDAKQKELQRIEDAKKAQAEKDKPTDPKQDSFAEKMANQIIKNLQVNISNIHIRYEDNFTNPSKPFAIGVTLKGLSFETTDENWTPMIIKETVQNIFKMVKLDSLAAYWNCNSPSYTKLSRQQILDSLKDNIVAPGLQTDYQYLIEPISSSAKLRLNTKPENTNFSMAKVLLDVVFQQIAVSLSKKQFQDILEVLESFERMNLASKFRKYRPDVATKKGNAKIWWKFAYNCILEETVRRRRKMWSWENIKYHRDLCRMYKQTYKKKLTTKKVTVDEQKVLDKCEEELTVFSITLLRQQAEVEVRKEGLKKQESTSGGWFSGWWGGGSKKEDTKKDTKDEITDKFAELMTAEEKAKLYQAIGYQENVADATLPIEYIANELHFKLEQLSLTLKDTDKKAPQVLGVHLQSVVADISQRPAADAVKVESKIDSMQVVGVLPDGGGSPPNLVSSKNKEANNYLSLLETMFETNPLDKKCDTRVRVFSRPLEIVYDANTINEIVEFFKPPESVYLKQLQGAAMAKFETLKEQTATSMAYTIEHHKYTDIAVDLKPSYVIIPDKGVYRKDAHMIVLHLGNLQVNSGEQDKTPISPGAEGKLTVEEVMERAYDKFNLDLTHIQLMYVHPGDDWQRAMASGMQSPLHILKPMSINISLEKAILQDPKLPKTRISGELPQVAVHMSDVRLHEILQLVQSIPFPESPPAPPEEDDTDVLDVANIASEGDADVLLRKIPLTGESREGSEQAVGKVLKPQASQDYINSIDVQLKFEIKEISLHLSQLTNGQNIPMVKVVIDSLGTQLKITTFDMQVAAYLGGIYVQHMQYKALHGGPLINLVNTPVVDEEHKLLVVEYLKANKKNPEFSTTYKNTEQKVKVTFTALEVLLHQEALVSLLEFAQKLQPTPAPASAAPPPVEVVHVAQVNTAPPKEAGTEEEKAAKLAKALRIQRRKEKEAELIDIAIEAQLERLTLCMCTVDKVLVDVRIKGLDAYVGVQKHQTKVSTSLKDIVVLDPAPGTLYKNILSIEGSEVFKADIMVYNIATAGDNYSDMSAVDTSVEFQSGVMKVVFLNKFVMDLLAFIDQFQAAKDSMAQAASAAAESAATAAATLSSRAPRISLDVKLKAPVVIAPQSSTSPNAVMIDLGKLILKNGFESVPGSKSPDGLPAVLDKMSIDLTSLKISRALMNGDTVQSESLILEPVNISLNMTRNLSAGWFNNVPDIDIAGELEAFAVNLSQGDFTVIMSLLNDNLGEKGQMSPAKPVAAPIEQPVSAEQASTAAAAPTGPPGSTPAVQTAVAVVYTKMKFSFALKTINATLYKGENTLTNGVVVRDKDLSLGRFELQAITIEGNIKNNNAIKAHVALHSMILDDTRPGREQAINSGRVLRMVDLSKTTSQKATNMIDLSFDQTAELDKDANIQVNGLYICVCLEYLMSLGDFFVKGMPQPPENTAENKTKQTNAAHPTAASATAPASQPPQPAGSMKLQLAVNHPEIIMVEDATKIDTNALILNTHVTFLLRQTPEQMIMKGDIVGFNIYSCCYAPDKREKTKTLILNPMDVGLQGSAPDGGAQHISILVSDIIMNVSPTTIRTITATLSGLSGSQDEKASEEKTAERYPGLWNTRQVQDCDFWFLKAEEATEASDDMALQIVSDSEEAAAPRGEQLMLSVDKIVFKMEGEVGRRTVPLLITEMRFGAEVKDWSSKLYVSAELKMEVAYYNELLAVWEPIIEPVEGPSGYKPWELGMEVTANPEQIVDLFEEGDEAKMSLPPPKMCIEIHSSDILQTTITRTCLDVLTNLGKAFTDAYNLVEPEEKKADLELAPYVVKNDTGHTFVMRLDDTFKEPAGVKDGHIKLTSGTSLPLYICEQEQKLVKGKSVIKNTQEDHLRKIILIMEEFGVTREIRVLKAEKRAFCINRKAYPGDPWMLISQTDASYGCKTITFRSMLQVENHLPFGVDVFYHCGGGKTAKCGEMKPKELLNISLDAVYSAPYELFFKPHKPEYGQSTIPLNWKDLSAAKSSVVTCDATSGGKSPLYFNVSSEESEVLFDQTGEKSVKSYRLGLRPCAVFKNLLPFDVQYNIQDAGTAENIEGGETKPLFNAKIGTSTLEAKILNYRGKDWVGKKVMEENPDELSIWTFDASDESSMDLGLHTVRKDGYHQLSLFCPYWVINKTQRDLTYKAGEEAVFDHAADFSGVMLFTFKSKSFFSKKKEENDDDEKRSTLGRDSERHGSIPHSESSEKNAKRGSLGRGAKCPTGSPKKKEKKEKKKKISKGKTTKACLKVGESEWSDKFSLDTVGSSGTVSCKFKGFNYEVGVRIALSCEGLTKVVTFTPYFMIVNEAPVLLSCKEVLPDAMWYDVAPGECLPFWPVQTSKKMEMMIKVRDEPELETPGFCFTEEHTTLLPFQHEYGGMNVECNVLESAVEVKIQQYQIGHAAVLLVNHTAGARVQYNQSGSKDPAKECLPGEVVLYTWQDPLLKRELVWSCGKEKDQKNDLVKDGVSDFFYDADNKVYWVSFLDGMQRILLFTDDMNIAKLVQQSECLEQMDQDITLSLQGFGLSLVNNLIHKELAYISITSSGVIWEMQKKKKRYKALKNKQIDAIEEAFQVYENAKLAGETPNSRVVLAEKKLEVDFGMDPVYMFKPHKCVIRRSYENGIWVQYRTSPHQLHFHAKIHRFQLDNQLPGAVFQVVLAPVPPPKSVSAESVPKPFTEVSVMIRKRDFDNVQQFKYCKVLIQEMAVQVDQGFINALIAMFAQGEASEEAQREAFLEDCKQIDTQLIDEVTASSAGQQKNYYENLHFSPLKIHLSFSMYAGGGDEEAAAIPISSSVLSVFLQSVGVVLSDIQDVIFKLAYFERNFKFLNQTQLTGEIGRHYSQQAIKQMYVLVLGLDVLGNPFGVIRGIATGIEDLFYEPYQGAIQGPEEFAEGLAYGVKSLFGHAVGGAAGAVSRITGALGKGIATLTLDDDYQRKRREQMSKQPTDLKEGLARGGKGLVMGVVDGVTGIVTKPVQGAKEGGAEGFFKGVGKGLVGAFTRPASGVVDFASTSFAGIKRAAEMGDEVRRQRPPRFLQADGIVRPYSRIEAEGNDILQDVEKGRFAETDSYICHLIVTKDLKNALLATTKRVLFATKGEIFGHWNCEWNYVWADLKEAPSVTSKGVQILLKEKQKKSFFSSGTVGKLIPIEDRKASEWIVMKMKDAISKAT